LGVGRIFSFEQTWGRAVRASHNSQEFGALLIWDRLPQNAAGTLTTPLPRYERYFCAVPRTKVAIEAPSTPCCTLKAMIVDTILGLAGLGVSVFAIIDNRHQRSQREKAVIAARSVIERAYGTLIGIKPGVAANAALAVNDALAAINQARNTQKSLN
jgi:hypothetical protein